MTPDPDRGATEPDRPPVTKPDQAVTDEDRTIDRRSFLQVTGGLAAVAVGDEVGGLVSSARASPASPTRVDDPDLYGYGGRTALPDGGTTVVTTGSDDADPVAPGPGHSEVAPQVASDKRVHAELGSGSEDWLAVEADRNDSIRLEFDRRASTGTTGLFLYGPDGRLKDRLSVDAEGSRELRGVADRSGPHLVRTVDLGDGEGPYSVAVRTGDPRDGGTLGTTTLQQSPFDGTPQTIPGTVQAQKFDVGGEGVAYHDTTAENLGGAFRPDEAVDLQPAHDDTGEYNVGWIDAGEWLEYTVDVTPGTYTLQARVASPDGGRFEVFLDGDSLGTVDVPATGGWQAWETVSLGGLDLSQDGTAVLRVEARTDAFNLNWLDFAGQRPYGDTPQTIPGKVQAEKFDVGGEGTAYHDTSDANYGGAFRPDEAVDLQRADDGTNEFNVGWIDAGEWLEYTVEASSGTYAMSARVASPGGGRFEVFLDGDSLGTVDVPATGGWQAWETVTIDGVDLPASGSGILRVEARTDAFNLNWLAFRRADDESYGEQGYGEYGYGGT